MKKKKRLSYRAKLAWLIIGGFIVTFAPLLTAVCINWTHYFDSTLSSLGITVGGFTVLIIIILQLLGKLGKLMGSGFVATGVMFFLAVCFSTIIGDLVLLLGMTFLGEGMYSVFFKYPICRMRKIVDYHDQASITKEVLEDKKYE